MEKYLTRLCKAIISERFNDENYRVRKSWYGKEIETTPLFAPYGAIGFTATVYDECYHTTFEITYDRELKRLEIEERPWKDYINLFYLEENDIYYSENPAWQDKPRSVELSTYTEGGEDMIICLEEPTASQLQGYIDDFDIDEMVSMWWEHGRPGKGVPFNNMKEHYEDYEDFLENLQEICDKMPF